MMSFRSNPGSQMLSRGRRRGVALVLAVSMTALLLTFLIAAQTSVMSSIMLIKRSHDRMEDARLTDRALARAHEALRSTTQDSGQLQIGGQDAPPVGVSYERLSAGGEVYTSLPGISGHRAGDAVVDVTLEEGGTPHRYLINTQSRRSGALRIQ